MNKWKIPQSFINELLLQTNIIDLINSKIELKRKGSNYQSLCPFHSEKTPSFIVNEKKQFYYCFGCNAHGNAIDFLIDYEKLNFLDSIEQLSIINGQNDIFKSFFIKKNNYLFKKNIFFELMKKVKNFYQKNLFSKNNYMILNYLKNRGVKNDIIKLFNIGYSNEKNNIFLNFKEAEKKILIKSGIIINKNKEKNYEHFRNRIMFPIRNKYGKISGFGGRLVNNLKKPKYLNSSETDFFKKREQIYGIYEIFKKNKNTEIILVVEGYFDVIILYQFNIKYPVVAILGTSINEKQIQYLFKISNTIIYCYDGDSAGRIAAWRTLIISLTYIEDKKNIKFIFLPKGHDPDSIIRKEGKEKFEKRIEQSICFSEFIFKKLSKNNSLTSLSEKSKFSSLIIPLIKKIPGKTIQFYLLQMLGSKIGILEINQLKKFLKNKDKTYKNFNIIKKTPIRILIGLLIQNPELFQLVPLEIIATNLNISGFSIFLKLLRFCIKNPSYNTMQILEMFRNFKIGKILKKLTILDYMVEKNQTKKMFLDILIKIYQQQLEKKLEKLISKERKIGLNTNEKKELWYINVSLSKIKK
ncbi:DNA primase [Buchnera aphidicola (Tetraneura ulmi)]|uniref:DNA primase n=1 Tax=Buchnera aphidicola TaxID=9 RepID=UPI0034639463